MDLTNMNFADGFKKSDIKTRSPNKGYLIGKTVYKDKKWFVKIEGKPDLYPIAKEQCIIPFKTKCKLYALPDVGHSYEDWHEKDNKVIKYQNDTREYEVIAKYWSIFKPGFKLKGNIKDGIFVILRDSYKKTKNARNTKK